MVRSAALMGDQMKKKRTVRTCIPHAWARYFGGKILSTSHVQKLVVSGIILIWTQGKLMSGYEGDKNAHGQGPLVFVILVMSLLTSVCCYRNIFILVHFFTVTVTACVRTLNIQFYSLLNETIFFLKKQMKLKLFKNLNSFVFSSSSAHRKSIELSME